MRATLPNYLTCNQKETLRRVQHEARKAWWREGHPGWGIWDVMPEEVLHREAHLQVDTYILWLCQCMCLRSFVASWHCYRKQHAGHQSACSKPSHANLLPFESNVKPQRLQSCDAAATPKWHAW